VSTRTFERDLLALQEAGVPIRTDGKDEKPGVSSQESDESR
jgi:predicted DNA-binding transcriptional regulator YafY